MRGNWERASRVEPGAQDHGLDPNSPAYLLTEWLVVTKPFSDLEKYIMLWLALVWVLGILTRAPNLIV